MLAPGTTPGPYTIGDLLGVGGMGEVYRAHDTRLNRAVAIKVLPPHLAGDRASLERFRREMRAAAALSHPNILAIFDIGSEGGVHYAVTELLQGENLRAWIARAGEGVRPRLAFFPEQHPRRVCRASRRRLRAARGEAARRLDRVDPRSRRARRAAPRSDIRRRYIRRRLPIHCDLSMCLHVHNRMTLRALDARVPPRLLASACRPA
ncbi:MAG TPA: protein kinase [Thermoanaerobaculia bacterium]|nr:protein kinase [Thermoanaerobaculia bacterium]